MSKQVKIAHLTSAHPDGDVRIFHKECVSLATAGFDVSMILPNTISRTEKGVSIVSFPAKKGSRFYRMFNVVNKVCREAIILDADVYHLHDPELLRIALKLKRKGKTVIYDAHEDLPRQIISKAYIPKLFRKIIASIIEKYENSRVRKLDGAITATPFIRDRFIKVNANTIDINNYPLIEEIDFIEQSWTDKNRSVCYIGGLTEIRGIKELVLAAGIADIQIEVAGELSESLKTKLQSLNGWKNIKLHGYISRKESMTLKAKSMAGVVTFLKAENHINAQPNKIFEYMASGIPVISSNFELWKQIVEKNECGICVDPSDPNEIAKAIIFVVDNPEAAKKMGENGIRLVKEKYNWDIEKKKLVEFYLKLI